MRNAPPGMRTRSSGVIFENGKLQLSLVRVDAVEEHTHAVADRKLAARAFAHDLADVLLISVLIARKRVDGHQSLDEQVSELDEQSVLSGADHQRVKILAHAL